MKHLAILALFCITFTGCANMPMERVMRLCDTGESFNTYATCIRQKYDAEGNQPNWPSVRAFYAILDEINEANKLGKMTEVQAKAGAYKAFLATIHAENRANSSKSSYCTVVGNTVICN